MFRTFTRSAALSLSLAMAALPAWSDGSISLTLTPRNAGEANALRLGLGLYALQQHLEGGGSIEQFGRDNAAALQQTGDGNWGLIRQQGQGHTGILTQTGNANAYALFQSGKGTDAQINQSGTGGVGVTIVHGF